MAVRVTQTNKEIAATADVRVRVTQTNAEIAQSDGDPRIRVTQASAEIAQSDGDPRVRVTQASAEIAQSDGNPRVRATQANLEILVWANSWVIYWMGEIDESSVPAPTVLLQPPPPPPVFYYYPSGGGRVLRYKPKGSEADKRLLARQRIWESYARAAVEGSGMSGLGVSLGRISNGMRWLEQGRHRSPWMRQGSIVTPAPAAGDVTVCEFEVPEGYHGYLNGFWWAYTGTGYVEGSTDIEWRIRVADQYPDGYGRVRFQMGTPTDPLTITGMLPLRSRQRVRLVVFVKNDSGLIQVGSSRIIGGLRGWLYEPEFRRGGVSW